ncbi:hypothetical protein OESDEN_22266 [Oesophagostomum dentatum]|uniref:Uncharacterized protein n=1 Tax=Oesophagostomum dentatum TaxID=61180 RepID=A0A0B1RZM3_OESDE|nr:hypothetical protein OESDEN_22266 [Oesophagostomum dentatum]
MPLFQRVVVTAIYLFLQQVAVRSGILRQRRRSVFHLEAVVDFYVVPLFILALVMNKTISGNIRMIYDQ